MTCFDPALAKVVLGWKRDRARWESVRSPDTIAAVVRSEPLDHVHISPLSAHTLAFAEVATEL